MGRNKTSSRDEVLTQAMEVFRETGFAGTTAEMLVERTGVSRYSLYSDFKSLQSLFEAALERYNDEIIDQRFGPLEQPDAGLDEIYALLSFYGVAGGGPASGKGCLLCNTAVEFGPNDLTGSQATQRYFKRLKSAFTNALKNAQSSGDLSQKTNVYEEADLLTAVVLGLFVMIRSQAPISGIENAANSAKQRILAMSAKSAY